MNELNIEWTVRHREEIQDAHVNYLWAFMKYLIRIITDEDKLLRLCDITLKKRLEIFRENIDKSFENL